MSKSGGIVTTYIFRIAFRQFWTWWTMRLSEALPDAMVRRFAPESHQDYREIDVEAGGDAVAGEPVVILLAGKNVLVRATRYPFQAANAIPDLLAAEVDRFTPFDAADVALAHRIVEYDWAAKEISVLFAAVRRQTLSRLFEQALASGHVPAGAVVHQGGVSLRFSDPGPDEASGATRSRFNMWMAAASVALLIALALPSLMMQRQNTELSARLSEVRARAEAGASSVAQANQIENTRRFMEQQIGEVVPPLQLLSELSRLLPHDSWITSLNLQENKLTLQGNSAKASEVVTALAGSKLLSGVQYQASVTRDPRNNLERFSITAKVEKARDASGGGAGQ